MAQEASKQVQITPPWIDPTGEVITVRSNSAFSTQDTPVLRFTFTAAAIPPSRRLLKENKQQQNADTISSSSSSRSIGNDGSDAVCRVLMIDTGLTCSSFAHEYSQPIHTRQLLQTDGLPKAVAAFNPAVITHVLTEDTEATSQRTRQLQQIHRPQAVAAFNPAAITPALAEDIEDASQRTRLLLQTVTTFDSACTAISDSEVQCAANAAAADATAQLAFSRNAQDFVTLDTRMPVRVDAPPVAADDFYGVPVTAGTDLDVLQNDVVAYGAARVQSVTTSRVADVTLCADAACIVYTPLLRFSGYDDVGYTMADERGRLVSASVRVYIQPSAPRLINLPTYYQLAQASTLQLPSGTILDYKDTAWQLTSRVTLHLDAHAPPPQDWPQTYTSTTPENANIWGVNATAQAALAPEARVSEVYFTGTFSAVTLALAALRVPLPATFCGAGVVTLSVCDQWGLCAEHNAALWVAPDQSGLTLSDAFAVEADLALDSGNDSAVQLAVGVGECVLSGAAVQAAAISLALTGDAEATTEQVLF